MCTFIKPAPVGLYADKHHLGQGSEAEALSVHCITLACD
jgi:hypothetical protein